MEFKFPWEEEDEQHAVNKQKAEEFERTTGANQRAEEEAPAEEGDITDYVPGAGTIKGIAKGGLKSAIRMGIKKAEQQGAKAAVNKAKEGVSHKQWNKTPEQRREEAHSAIAAQQAKARPAETIKQSSAGVMDKAAGMKRDDQLKLLQGQLDNPGIDPARKMKIMEILKRFRGEQ